MTQAIWEQGYTQNRELSWLQFNARVLAEAEDENVPLLERCKFLSIFTSNLDEFFMIRVGSLCDMAAVDKDHVDNKSGMTAKEQLRHIYAAVAPLYERRDAAFADVAARLAAEGLRHLSFQDLEPAEHKYIKQYFKNVIAPVLSPQIVDAHHPFPHLEGKVLHIAALLSRKKSERLGLLPVPASLPALVFLPGEEKRYIPIEDVLLEYVGHVFEMYDVLEKTVFCVTRNADINPDDETFGAEEGDFRTKMEKLLRRRRRMAVVRVELSRPISDHFTEYFRKRFDVSDAQIFLSRKAPLQMSYAFSLGEHFPDKRRAALSDPPFSPQQPAMLPAGQSLLKAALKRDILLSYPYESMEPFLQMIREAANDPAVLSIRITIYRLARKAKLVEYLCAAAENGKDVTALIELRARFDEQNNINYATMLEEAGCTVIYGLSDYKIHAKLCLITRKVHNQIRYITQVGTGNYNEKTSELYTDLSFISTDQQMGEDATHVFQALCMGEVVDSTQSLWVAPNCFETNVIRYIEQEIETARAGKPAYVFIKVNSLNDMEVMEKLIEASQAGVKVEMVIRGICCLCPGIEGFTDNIHIKSIVGRYLEHSRIFIFGADEDTQRIFMGSGDLLNRNTRRRVEVFTEVKSGAARRDIKRVVEAIRMDNQNSWQMLPDGSYLKDNSDHAEPLDSHMYLHEYFANPFELPVKKESFAERFFHRFKKK